MCFDEIEFSVYSEELHQLFISPTSSSQKNEHENIDGHLIEREKGNLLVQWHTVDPDVS